MKMSHHSRGGSLLENILGNENNRLDPKLITGILEEWQDWMMGPQSEGLMWEYKRGDELLTWRTKDRDLLA